MGLAASQARLLLLTARKSDLEYRAQSITNTMMVLAMKTEEVARVYSNKIGNTALFFNGDSSTGALTAKDIDLIANGAYVLYINGEPWHSKEYFEMDKTNKKYTEVVSALDSQNKLAVALSDKVVAYENTQDGRLVGFNTFWADDNQTLRDSGLYSQVVVDNTGSVDNYGSEELYEMFKSGRAVIRDSFTQEPIDVKEEHPEMEPINTDFSQIGISAQVRPYIEDESSLDHIISGIKDGTYEMYIDEKLIDSKDLDSKLALSKPVVLDSAVVTNSNYKDYNALELIEMLNNGTAQIRYKVTGELVSLSGNTNFTESYYTDDDAAAEAEYKKQTASIQVKEKRLQMELNQIEAQQKACDTEIDSVKKVMDKNIERTFKVFS